jgi:hypothetical protein
MASKELVKKEKETAVSPFVVFQTAIAEIREAVTANLGDRRLLFLLHEFFACHG